VLYVVVHSSHKAMYIPGTIKEWEEWTGLTFIESGEYTVLGALSQIHIDVKSNLGEYTEPNVWVVHEIEH